MGHLRRAGLGAKIFIPTWWFWIALALAATKRYAFHPSGIKLLDNYLLDLLCMPLVLEVTRQAMRLIFSPNYNLSKFQILFALIYVSVLFEYLLPSYQTRFHSDVVDVVVYCAGTIIWYRFLPK
jgi:hypothetical protein